MKTLKIRQYSCFWIIVLILILPISECNAQLRKMTNRELTIKSTSVIYGKCSEVRSEWNESRDMIFTTVTIAPEGYVKGNLGGQAVITVPGGRIGDIIYEVSEMPVFTRGEEVFAFVYSHPSGKNLVTGGFQGKMRIEKDPATGKRMVKSKKITTKALSKDLKGVDTKPVATDKTLLEDLIKEVEGYLK